MRERALFEALRPSLFDLRNICNGNYSKTIFCLWQTITVLCNISMTNKSKEMNTSDDQQLKAALMELWKDTFGDSDDYVRLVFDNYFKRDMVEFEIRDGRLIAGLLGVPYRLRRASKEAMGVYMCGLATRPEFRRQGIMHRLIGRFCERMKSKDFTFAFLFSASHDLKNYYRKSCFFDASKKYMRYKYIHFLNVKKSSKKSIERLAVDKSIVEIIKENYLSIQGLNDKSEIELFVNNIYFKYCFNNNVNIENVIKIISNIIELSRYINTRKLLSTDILVLHSIKDTAIAIYENYISGGIILISRDELGELDGVLFCSNIENGEASLPLLDSDSEEKEDALILTLRNFYPGIDVVATPVDSIIPNSMLRILDWETAADFFGKNEKFNSLLRMGGNQSSMFGKNDINGSVPHHLINLNRVTSSPAISLGISLMLE